MSATDRGMLLYRLGQLIDENAAALAEVEARNNGKLLSEVSGQVRYVAKYFYYYAGLADKIQGSVIPIDKPKVFNYQIRTHGCSGLHHAMEFVASAYRLEDGPAPAEATPSSLSRPNSPPRRCSNSRSSSHRLASRPESLT